MAAISHAAVLPALTQGLWQMQLQERVTGEPLEKERSSGTKLRSCWSRSMARLSLSSWNLLQRLLSEPADEALWDQTIAEETINAELTELALQAFGIEVQNAGSVSRYMQEHSEMLFLVADVGSALLAGLIGYTQVLLSLYVDPEIDDEYLSINVRAMDYPEDFLDRLDEICASFEERIEEVSGWLVVSTDFEPPRK